MSLDGSISSVPANCLLSLDPKVSRFFSTCVGQVVIGGPFSQSMKLLDSLVLKDRVRRSPQRGHIGSTNHDHS